MPQCVLGPGQVLQVDVPGLLGGTHLAIAFDGGDEIPSGPVDELQVLHRGIPVVEQDGLRMDAFVGDRDRIMTDNLVAFQVINPVRTYVVPGGGNQVFDVLVFGKHDFGTNLMIISRRKSPLYAEKLFAQAKVLKRSPA